MSLISKFLDGRERKEQERIKKVLVGRLSEMGVEVLDSTPENPHEFLFKQKNVIHPDIFGSSMTREGAERNFLEEIKRRGVQSLYDLRYEYSSVGTAVWAEVYREEPKN